MKVALMRVLLISIFVLGLAATAEAVSIAPSNSNVQYMGRWNHDNADEPWVAWKGSTIKVRFTGTAITGEFDAGSTTEQFRVIIDGVPNQSVISMSKDKKTYTLASGLFDGEHVVEIMRETFNGHNTTFYGFEITGSIMTPPAKPSMKIEFFGDSNMDGTSLYSEQDSGDHGSYYAFPATVARMLNAEFNDQSVGGATIDDGGDNDVMSFIKSADYYNGNNWTPNFDPDVIVINAGANDVGAGETTIKNRFKDVIAELRSVYGNGPHIVLHNGYGWDKDEPANYTMDLLSEVGGNLSINHYPWVPQHWHGSMVEQSGQANLLVDHILGLGLGFTQVQDSEVFDGFGHNFDVANGSFEGLAMSGFDSYGWRYIGDSGIERRYDPSGAYDGDYYMRFTAGSDNAGSGQQGNDATGDFVANSTTDNQKYYVTAAIRGANGGEKAQIVLDYQGQEIWTRANAQTVTFTVTDQWQEYTGEFTAPNGTWMTYVKVRADSGTVDFDAVSMSDTLTPSFCGDGTCDPDEDECSCSDDCGNPPTENCTNSTDDDCDGDVDCDDADCASNPACIPAFCGDDTCDPGEDSCNCAADCGNPPSEDCANSSDDDCDGDVDCDDSDCDAYPACIPDFDAPTPDPMTFASAPAATGNSTIAMTATTASDLNGVEYYFTCTSGAGNDSGWQNGTSYTDSGLSSDTTYAYTVEARDKSSNANATLASAALAATTDSQPSDVVAITKAEYKADKSEFKVEATSSDGGNVTLTVVGYGDMAYDSGKNLHKLSLKPLVGLPPCTATVVSTGGGTASKTVTGADPCIDDSYCGDGTCDAGEDRCNCSSDCGAPFAEVCDNGVSDDCDGLVDCDDADCASFPACIPAYCGDGTCDPGEDTCNCPGDCGTPPAEICDNGSDEDCDGDVDCDDADCVSFPACIPAFCGDATCDPGEDQCNCASDCGTPPSTESSCTDSDDNDCDGDTDCADTDCVGDPACYVAYCGSGICDAGEDQCNCATDCGTPPAAEADCTDGDDEDCDGDADCADTDCVDDPACYVAYCGSGICDAGEDQCNCATDCGTPPSSETSCTDGVSDDCDGDVDCADSDCADDPACISGDIVITIINNSFEVPALSGTSYETEFDNIPSWDCDNDNVEYHGVWNPGSYGGYVASPDGSNSLGMNNGGDVYQNTGHVIVEGATYTMTASVVNDESGGSIGMRMRGTSVLVESLKSTGASYADVSISFTASAAQAGQTLIVELYDDAGYDSVDNIRLSYVAGSGSTPDTDAPTPDPMTFASAPAATGTSSIAMTATMASDASGVEYYFTNVAGGGNDSGWQSSASYEDTGLAADSTYSYTVMARDLSVNLNATLASAALAATTDAASSGDVVTIIKAEYNADKSEIKVEATSSDQPNVTLTVVGYGDMTWLADKNKYEYKKKPVSAPGSSVTVTSSDGGSATKNVTFK